jgi:hypothetical protein
MRSSVRAPVLFVVAALAACATSRERPEEDSGRSALAEYFERSLVSRADPVIRQLIDGQTYYYTTSPCCDLLNPLYDAQGKFVCAPDGGFTGRGDGRCPANLSVQQPQGEPVPNPFYAR